MGKLNFPVISIGDKTGTVELNVAAAGKIAIPTMENGALPKFVHVVLMGATGQLVAVCPTVDANGAAATGLPLSTDNPEGIILNVHGFSHIGFEDIAGAGTSDLYLYPLEDF
jgi:hypothetical protein